MTQAANTYAQALYALAKDEGLDAQILQEMDVLKQAFDREPEFVRLLSAPNLPKAERCGILDESFRGKVHIYVLNFMKIGDPNGEGLPAWENNSDSARVLEFGDTTAMTGEKYLALYAIMDRMTGWDK